MEMFSSRTLEHSFGPVCCLDKCPHFTCRLTRKDIRLLKDTSRVAIESRFQESQDSNLNTKENKEMQSLPPYTLVAFLT